MKIIILTLFLVLILAPIEAAYPQAQKSRRPPGNSEKRKASTQNPPPPIRKHNNVQKSLDSNQDDDDDSQDMFYDYVVNSDDGFDYIIQTQILADDIDLCNYYSDAVFDQFDQDQSGELEWQELHSIITYEAGFFFFPPPDPSWTDEFMMDYDSDGSGTINMTEYRNCFHDWIVFMDSGYKTL